MRRHTKASQRKQDRANALAAAHHAYAIKRAVELTPNEAVRQALIRFGPVPQFCQRCHQQPPTTILMVGSGQWLCNECAHPKRNTP